MLHCDLNFKKLKKRETKHWQLSKLKDEMVQNQYAIETDKAIENIRTEEVRNVEIKWSGIKAVSYTHLGHF